MCKDLGLNVSVSDIDIIFAQVVPKGQRRIGFMQFENALKLLADKADTTFEELEDLVRDSSGPILRGTTQALHVTLADGAQPDLTSGRSTSRQLGAEQSPRNGTRRPSQCTTLPVVQRSERRASSCRLPVGGRCADSLAVGQQPKKPMSRDASPRRSVMRTPAKDMLEAWDRFSNGKDQMDGMTFARMCKDCILTQKDFLDTGSIDIVFQTAVGKGKKHMTFFEFGKAMDLIAERKNRDIHDVEAVVMLTGGPELSDAQKK
jgi:hypothetical protein